MTPKDQLRCDLRKIRQNFVKQDNIQNSFDQFAVVMHSVIMPSSCVAAYQKTGSEVSADAILRAVDALDVKMALPFIAARGEIMGFRQWRYGEALFKSPYGFLQPAANTADAVPDIILVPLLGFDRTMNRIGQGAGHYDRIFVRHPAALRIGLAWSCQERPEIPTDPWDVPLDGVLTEKEWIKPRLSRIRQ